MSYVMVDVESDGPCPGLYSMVEIGAIVVEPGLSNTFYGKLRPISEKYMQEALDVCHLTREDTLKYRDPGEVMSEFAKWIADIPKPVMFVSDNNGFDWQWVNYYFWRYLESNPFGHSSTNLGSLYKGLIKDMRKNFKHLRETRHTHNPVDDARGNAEAFLKLKTQFGLRMNFK
ncbi:MAG: 3'-5' exonuclease [Acidiferrobacterales bacterium]